MRERAVVFEVIPKSRGVESRVDSVAVRIAMDWCFDTGSTSVVSMSDLEQQRDGFFWTLEEECKRRGLEPPDQRAQACVCSVFLRLY